MCVCVCAYLCLHMGERKGGCMCPQTPPSVLIKKNAWQFVSEANENDTVERVLCLFEWSSWLNEMLSKSLENIRGQSEEP